MVTKSQVLNYQPVHFAEGAEHFAAGGGQWEASSNAQHHEAMGLEWKGIAAAAYRAVAAADHATIMAASQQAAAAAQLAAAQGVIVWEAKQTAVFALEDADAAGFDVSEDFQLSDRIAATGLLQRELRQDELTAHSQAIGIAVNDLVSRDQAAARMIASAADFSPFHTNPNGHIQAVDSRGPGGLGFDHDPITGEPIGPPPADIPDGKAAWYHPGVGWTVDDHLEQCSGTRVAKDLLSILGVLVPPNITSPLTDANAVVGAIDIDKCEGP